MQGTILTFGIVASILAIVLKPKHALIVYIAVLVWVPEYLRVSIGTIDISCGRMVVSTLLLRCLCSNKIKSKFKWSQLDKAVLYSMVVYVGVTLMTQPKWASIENRAGFLMDTWFSYLVARFIITDRDAIITLIKGTSLVLIPLAILGCIEAVSGWQPFIHLKRFRSWDPLVGDIKKQMRWGFTRAVGPFSHPILFGGGFALFLPLIYCLRHEKNIWKSLAYIIFAIIVAGALSSISSGPWVMVALVFFCLALQSYRKWLKLMVYFFLGSCLFIQIFSNRPFYHVFFSYASKLGGTGWHRARLIDLAIQNFNQWWVAGYAGENPNWGAALGVSWTDVTNEYILAGVRYGLAGVIVLCYVLYVAFKMIVKAYRKENDPYMKSIYWSLGSLLFAVIVAWTSVSFFGQLMPLYYFFLGMTGSSCMFVLDKNKKRKKQVVVVRHRKISKTNSENELSVNDELKESHC